MGRWAWRREAGGVAEHRWASASSVAGPPVVEPRGAQRARPSRPARTVLVCGDHLAVAMTGSVETCRWGSSGRAPGCASNSVSASSPFSVPVESRQSPWGTWRAWRRRPDVARGRGASDARCAGGYDRNGPNRGRKARFFVRGDRRDVRDTGRGEHVAGSSTSRAMAPRIVRGGATLVSKRSAMVSKRGGGRCSARAPTVARPAGCLTTFLLAVRRCLRRRWSFDPEGCLSVSDAPAYIPV